MLLACAATLALTSPAIAGSYTATDDASLRTDITTANGDGAASSIITLGNDVTLAATALPVATKDLTIDSGSFTFLKAYTAPTANQGVVAFSGATTATVTLKGRVTGISGGANNVGQIALLLNGGTKVINQAIVTGGDGSGTGGGGIGVTIQNAATLTNYGTITGGRSANTLGGGGAFMLSGASLTNYGTVQGGDGQTGNYGVNAAGGPGQITSVINNGTISGSKGTAATGGPGVSVGSYTSLTNSGTILGGDGQTSGSIGVNIGGATGPSTMTNTGTIRGGNGTTGLGGVGILAKGTAQPITNSGTIQGGNAAAGIQASTAFSLILTNSGTVQGGAGAAAIIGSISPNTAITITNSGTLAAGAGYANAIEAKNATTTMSLELQAGSVITGNVAANSGVANTLTLGGDNNASFDVSTVGPQYQNFTVFNKTGNSVWSLTGTGSTATPWTISAGTLQIGDGTATGSIIGAVTDNATLAFNRSDSFTFANLITGTGGVTQLGSGTAILKATNTYTGPTTVSAGTLQVDGSIASPTATVAAGSALVVNGSISSSTVTVATGGTLSVNGSIIGNSAIAIGGIMKINGTAASSTVTVQGGGSLGGNGTVGATTIQGGGTIAPGNSIGTLHVNGAFTQNAGSIYQVEVDPTSNASDLILVNGTATIQNGATLNVTKNPQGAYRQGAQYTVLTASGGVTGSYALTGDTALSQYLALRESQDAGNVYLSIVQIADPAADAQTPNQVAVGGAVDSLPPAGSVPVAVVNSPTPTDTRSAFDALSGEAQASARGALVAGSLLVRDASFDRLRELFCAADASQQQNRPGCIAQDRPALWGRGFGNWGHLNGTANAAGLSQTTAGFLAGVDVPVFDWRFGVFGGYSRTDFDVTGRASSGASNNYHLGAYTGTQVGDTSVKLGASYSWNAIATDRAVAIGSLSNDLRARYTAGTTQIFGEVGQRFALNDFADGFVLEPFANVAHVKLSTAAFSESGGDAALTARAGTMENTFATLGVRPSMLLSWAGFDATLHGMLGFRHTFGSVTPTADVSFATGPVFTVTGAPIARNAGVVEAGADFGIARDIAFGVTYGGQFSGEETDHSVRGTITLTF